MKYLKYYEFNDIDPFGEEDWEEEELSDFMLCLKREYPDKTEWGNIKKLNC